MKKNIIVMTVLIVVFVGVYIIFQSINEIVLGGANQVWQGKVTNIDNSCNHDGVCKVEVSGYWIITDLGGDPIREIEIARGMHGEIYLSSNQKTNINSINIGQKVEVFVGLNENNILSLYGDSGYYIKIIK